MSGKHKHRQSLERPAGSRRPGPSKVKPGLGWKLPSLLALAGVALAAWFVANAWRHPYKAGDTANSPQVDRDVTTSAAPRPASMGASNPEFVNQVNRGNQLLAEGKAAEAVQVLTDAMRLNPQDDDVHYNLGLALARLGKLDEAILQYREALRIFPNYAEAHNNLGNVLMRQNRNEEAIEHFERAVGIMPDYASAHNNLGTALQKLGRTNDALLHFRQAVKLKPDYWQAHFNVGTSCSRQGEINEARSEFETVLRLQPDFAPAKSALEALLVRQSGPAQ